MRAPSAEKQEEAPTAKKAKHDENVRVRARNGEEVALSWDAAQLMGTLKDLMDLATSEDGMYPMPTILASTLQMVCKLNEPDYTWPSSDEHSLFQLVQLVEDALYLDAPIALKHIQHAIASRLNGKRALELCALIGEGGVFGSAEEQAAPIPDFRAMHEKATRLSVVSDSVLDAITDAIAQGTCTEDEAQTKLRNLLMGAKEDDVEPAFVTEDAEAPQRPASSTSSSTLPPEPLQQPSFSADAMEAALGLVDVATLAELKGVTRFWRALARRVLCSRLCRRDGQPVPTRLDEITDLDVEQLIQASRPGDAAIAGRMLPRLARLHGYGYVVDVAAVRAADLQNGAGDRRRPSLLHGTAKDALSNCISGEGEPPLELTIAAVACAGSGVVCGIPVQQMREDRVTELNLSNRGLHVAAAMLVAYLIPATSVLKNFNLLKNSFSVKTGTMLAKIGAEKGIMLSGMTRDQTKADFSNQNLQPADAILIASDLQFTAALTRLDIELNSIGPEGAKAITLALKVNAVLELQLDKLDVGYNSLNEQAALGIVRAARQEDKITFLGLSGCNIGPTGAKEIAAYIKFTAVLANLHLSANSIGDEGAKAIADALKSGREVLTTLGLSSNNIGDEGAKAIADALQSGKMAVLTKLFLRHNNWGNAGAKAVRDAVKGRIGFELKM